MDNRRDRIYKIALIAGIALIFFLPLVFSIFLAFRLMDISKSEGEVSARLEELSEKVSLLEKNGAEGVTEISPGSETRAASAVLNGNTVSEDEQDKDDKSGLSEHKRVYITFDDGPSVYTGQILDCLKKYGARATFFVCGTGDENDDLRQYYRRIVDEGHAIGMHSYSHVYSDLYYSSESFEYDLDKIRNLIYNETGVATSFYRFPGGSGNTVSTQDMSVFIPLLYAGGIEYYDWNVYPGDASGGDHSPEEIVSNTLNGVDKVDTAIIVLHDTGAKKSTVDALPEILEGLRERNCDILPFDDDTPVIHQFEFSEK